jgi:hypothetical protein
MRGKKDQSDQIQKCGGGSHRRVKERQGSQRGGDKPGEGRYGKAVAAEAAEDPWPE